MILPRLLIAGCNGQLGNDCVQVFKDYEILPVDLPELDITSPESVRGLIATFKPDALINCAAYTAVDKAETDIDLCTKVNVEGPAVLAKACADKNVFLVHVSTDYVFNGEKPTPRPWLETDLPEPRTVYGKTKLAGEQAISAAGCRYAILRTAWLYGTHGKNFPKTMLRLALADSDRTIKVVADQYGCPTWSLNLAEQIKALVEAPSLPVGVFHAVSRGSTTWHGFAAEFLRLMNVPHTLAPCTSTDYPTPAKRPVNSILEDRALDELGLCKMNHWQTSLARYVGQNRGALIAEARG